MQLDGHQAQSPKLRLALLVQEGLISGICVPAVSEPVPGGPYLGEKRAQLPCSLMSRCGQVREMPAAFSMHGGGCLCTRNCPDLAYYSWRGYMDSLAFL